MGNNFQEINDFIYGLEYDPKEVLAYDGEVIENFVSTEGEFDGDDFIVVERTKHTMSGHYDVAVPNSYRNITYPGGMLFANQDLINNAPNPLAAQRTPIKLMIDLPGLGKSNQEIIQNPDYANVSAGIDTMLDKWFANEQEIPAVLSCKKDILYNEKCMGIQFGLGGEYLSQELSIDFSAIDTQRSSAYLVLFKQIFYSVSVGLYDQPADAFHSSVTVTDLKNMGVNNENPPAYVQNVQYGREVYLLFESDLSSQELIAFLDATIVIPDDAGNMSFNVNGSAIYRDMANKISYTLTTLGGTSQIFTGTFNDSTMFEQVNALIVNNMKLSPSNPAYPLNYAPAFLKNNQVASINGTSEYTTTTSKKFNSGLIDLNHHGGFIARFNVNWNEISYDSEGNSHTTSQSWNKNGDNVTAPFRTEIPLKGNARNISIKCEGKTGLVWEPWRTNLDRKDISLSKKINVDIGGTTLNQKSSITYKN